MEEQRQDDLNFLNRYYESGLSNILVVYGHRNIEQDSFLLKFMENRKSFFYSARSASSGEQLRLWTEELKNDGISAGKIESYYDLFSACADSVGRAPVVFVIRNFENILKTDAAFMDQLTGYLEKNGKFKQVLVLLVSYDVNWVENSMVASLGNLAANIAGFRKIKPLPFSALRSFYPNMSYKDAVLTYSVLGGQTGLWR